MPISLYCSKKDWNVHKTQNCQIWAILEKKISRAERALPRGQFLTIFKVGILWLWMVFQRRDSTPGMEFFQRGDDPRFWPSKGGETPFPPPPMHSYVVYYLLCSMCFNNPQFLSIIDLYTIQIVQSYGWKRPHTKYIACILEWLCVLKGLHINSLFVLD